ncbi:hypothetical protein ACTFIW_000840 [Dictyostelium discoideum]
MTKSYAKWYRLIDMACLKSERSIHIWNAKKAYPEEKKSSSTPLFLSFSPSKLPDTTGEKYPKASSISPNKGNKLDGFNFEAFICVKSSPNLIHLEGLLTSMLFRETPQIGSKDRSYLRGDLCLFPMENIDRIIKSTCQLHTMLDYLFQKSSLMPCKRVGMRNLKLGISLNRPTPLTIRVNRAVTTPDELYNRLFEKGLPVIRDEDFPETLHFSKISRWVFDSQKQHVLDYCAGSGEKSLAIAPDMKGSGQIYLHDVRIGALHQARKRFKRAKIQHVQSIHSNEKAKMSKLRGKMDWVLVDAPCSGTGTVRRNPDMKWKFSMEMVHRLQGAEEHSQRGYNANRDLKSPVSFKTAPHSGVWDGFFAMLLGPVSKNEQILSVKDSITIDNQILATVRDHVITVLDLVKKMDMIFYRQYPEYRSSPEAGLQFYQTHWRAVLKEAID